MTLVWFPLLASCHLFQGKYLHMKIQMHNNNKITLLLLIDCLLMAFAASQNVTVLVYTGFGTFIPTYSLWRLTC